PPEASYPPATRRPNFVQNASPSICWSPLAAMSLIATAFHTFPSGEVQTEASWPSEPCREPTATNGGDVPWSGLTTSAICWSSGPPRPAVSASCQTSTPSAGGFVAADVPVPGSVVSELE